MNLSSYIGSGVATGGGGGTGHVPPIENAFFNCSRDDSLQRDDRTYHWLTYCIAVQGSPQNCGSSGSVACCHSR